MAAFCLDTKNDKILIVCILAQWHGSLCHFNWVEPSLVLLITPVLLRLGSTNSLPSFQAPSSLVADCRGGDSRRVFSDVHLEANADTSTISDSSISNASYPLTQPAQRQRRLNSTSNLRRSRFTGPCFGLLSGTADPGKASAVPHAQASPTEPSPSSSSSTQIESGQPGKRREFPGEGDHISVPVFAISEEEDRQPLVPAEHLDQTSAPAVLNGSVRGTHEGKWPVVGSTSTSPKNQRARPEWRPWGSQVSGGVCPFTTMTESNSVSDSQPSLGQSRVLCSVTNQMWPDRL